MMVPKLSEKKGETHFKKRNKVLIAPYRTYNLRLFTVTLGRHSF